MKNELEICIVGAGSSYTPELVSGILDHSMEDLPVTSLRLYDIDEQRLEVMGNLARRILHHGKREFEVSWDTDIGAMMTGTDFVISQIRVGGMQARHLDESIPLKYGIIGQETTGPGGMFKAFRTVPAMIEIGHAVARYAPEAFLLNYSNPSGIVTEAVAKHTEAKVIGLCSGMPGIEAKIRERVGSRFPDLEMYCVGLNHLGFMHKFVSQGVDVTDELLELLCRHETSSGDNADISRIESIRLLRAVPISYTDYYFRKTQRYEAARSRSQTRAQEIMAIEREVMAEAADTATVTKPAALQRRGGGGYSNITFDFLKAIHHDTGDRLPCTVQNRGAVNGIEEDAGVEIMARVDHRAATPIPIGDIPLAFRGVVQAVKAYETLTIQAAVQKSRSLAIQALMNHPLVGDIDIIEPMVDEMLEAHGLEFS